MVVKNSLWHSQLLCIHQALRMSKHTEPVGAARLSSALTDDSVGLPAALTATC